MNERLWKIDYLVLDILLDDIESPSDIRRVLNTQDAGFLRENNNMHFSQQDVEASLGRLLDERLVIPLVFSSSTAQLEELDRLDFPIRECWFKLTPKGREEAVRPFPWS
jgi:hypothetical protein